MIYSAEEVFMNTIVRIQIVSNQGTIFTKEKLYKAFDCFKYVVDKFSRFKKDSELSLLNTGKIKDGIVSQELFDLINLTLKASKETDGIYDPTIIDLLELYGYDEKGSFSGLSNKKLSDEVIIMCKNRPSVNDIVLDKKLKKIQLLKNQKIDLGSVGKGYAVDLAYDFLRKFNFDGILINAGGDIRSFGVNAHGLPWTIALYRAQLPNNAIDHNTKIDGNSWGNVILENESISGSGGWARKIGVFHHLLNPKTGFPINEVSQSFVIAKTATESDLYSTILFLLGPKGLSLISKKGLKGFVVDFKGNIFKSTDFNYF